MMQFVKNMQRSLPGSTGFGQTAETLLEIANMQKVFCLGKTIAHLPRNSQRMLIAIGGFGMPAELAFDIAETVPCLGFVPEGAKLALQD
jgi:hypothetical protein